MATTMRWIVAAEFSAALAVAACGGSVETTGGGSTTGAGANGNGGSGQAGGSSGGTIADLCSALCEAMVAHQCSSGSAAQCASECVTGATQGGDCSAPYKALLECAVNHLDAFTCEAPPAACAAAMQAVEACQGSGCNGTCSASGAGDCSCVDPCVSPEREVMCKPNPSGGLTCECLLGGQTVASCQDPAAVQCDTQQTCCVAAWGG